jgi:hypothetical protein
MPSFKGSPPPYSLAGVRTDDSVRVTAILLDSLRVQCHTLGFGEGSVVHCRAAGRASLVLDTPGGRSVSIDRDIARFIKVSRVDAAATAQLTA